MRSTFLLVAALVAVTACRPAPVKPATSAPVAVSARLVAVEESSASAPVPLTGVVRAGRQGLVSAQVMGDVIEVPARLGATVAAGDILVRLSSAELLSRLAQAKAATSEVERTRLQEQRLLEKGASTRVAVADLGDRLAAAQAAQAAAQAAVDHLTVRAPFAGVVSSKLVDVGDLATPGRPLLEVHSTSGAEIEAGVPTSLPALPPGANVTFVAGGRTGQGTVKELSSSSDAQTLNRRLVLSLVGAGPVPGYSVTVNWPGEPRPRLLIPATALQRHGQLERVWVADAQRRLELRLVRVTAAEQGKLEVSSGLRVGEQIVAEPSADLSEGAAVTAR